MARRRSIFKLPFSKVKIKINSKTIFNIIGFLLILIGIITLLSFANLLSPSDANGKMLAKINQSLIELFGGMSIFIPFIALLFSGHFFNGKKLKLVKPNISIGITLIFIALLGFFNAGAWGKSIYENLSQDFTSFGAIIILLVTFLIGLILFLDTSVDAFILLLLKLAKSSFLFIKRYVFRELLRGKKESRKEEEKEYKEHADDVFIKDAKTLIQKPIPATQHAVAEKKDFVIKPIISTGSTTWNFPSFNLLADIPQRAADRGDVNENADIIEKTLDSFGIRARVVDTNFGPTVTQYALEITRGTKLSKITALGNDLALALAAPTGQVRIEAPIPGRALVGIEIPNIKPEIVTLKKLLSGPLFTQNPDPLLVPLGLDVAGEPQVASIGKMPHVLIAGTTGSGKSVILNAWITTFLYRTKPDDLRMILVDPKRVELTLYNGIPHLLTEVVVEPDKIISALRWTVSEMEARYKEFSKVGVRNLEGYNEIEGIEKKPYILFVIDELADLMIFAPGDAEELITRIAQMARATGIHLILATQRPSVDVITGLMKANVPTRLAFNVSSMIDSRVIIDMPGAEKLLGKGDMLYLPPDQAKPKRIQGPFITEKEVNQVVHFLKSQTPEVHYTSEITQQETISFRRGGTMAVGSEDNNDPLFKQSVEIISQFDKASASLLQRRLSIGYARAARILDQLEVAGHVSPAEGSKPRTVVKRPNIQEEVQEESMNE